MRTRDHAAARTPARPRARRYLACGSEDQAAHVYDLRQGTLLARLGRAGSAVASVAFHPLHPQLAVGCLAGHVHFFSSDGT